MVSLADVPGDGGDATAVDGHGDDDCIIARATRAGNAECNNAASHDAHSA